MADDDDWEEVPLDRVSPILLFVISMLAFYFQAMVTEERFVPALNIIATRLSISDDVAGATLMAAGASAPELFSNFVSIFVTHSALGMGTIVGSEIFNQLVICAGAIFAAKNKTLILDPIIVMRDVFFYFLSLILLLWALSDRRAVDDDEENQHVFISRFHAGSLLVCYCLYVVVCANFNKWVNGSGTQEDDNSYLHYEAFEAKVPSELERPQLKKHVSLRKITPTMPFVRSFMREPTENFHIMKEVKSLDDGNVEMSSGQQIIQATSSIVTELYDLSDSKSFDIDQNKTSSCTPVPSLYLLDQFAPALTEIAGIEDIVRKDDSLSLYLWQRSSFYDKAKIDIHAWQLRWFTFCYNKIITLPDRRDVIDGVDNIYMLPLMHSFEIDESRLLIKVITDHKDYIFLAPTDAIFAAATRRFEELLQIPVIEMQYSTEISADTNDFHESMIHYPHGGSFLKKVFHIILLPIKAFIHFGIPDVRKTSAVPFSKAVISAILSVLFLIGGSYTMVATLDALAHDLNIPEAVMGATFSAAGTSLPNLIASQMAARQGLGNMAISNVFGSNTFNILIALGLPWFIYSCMNGGYYSELSDEGIAESIFVMALALAVFIILIISSKFQLRLWHAYFFYFLYFTFVFDYVGRCFI